MRWRVAFAVVLSALLFGCANVPSEPLTPEQTEMRATTAAKQPTSSPAVTNALSPTMSATQTPRIEDLSFDATTSTSPSGEWTLRLEVSAPVASGEGDNFREHVYTRMRFLSTELSIEWVPISEWSGYGAGYAPPQVEYWSRDGAFVLIADHSVPEGCPGFGVSYNLRLLDLASGDVALVSDHLQGVISVSPGEDWIVSVGHDRVVIYSMASGRVMVLSFESGSGSTASGNVVWSPDGRSFAFLTDFGYCADPPPMTTIWKVVLFERRVNPLIVSVPARLTIVEWLLGGRILLADSDGQRIWLDSETGTILDS